MGEFDSQQAGGAATDVDAIHDNVAAEISGIALKATLAAADIFVLEDSAAGNTKKRTTLSDIAAAVLIINGAGVGGSGTLNKIPLWTPDGSTLGDSALTQDSGSVANISGASGGLANVLWGIGSKNSGWDGDGSSILNAVLSGSNKIQINPTIIQMFTDLSIETGKKLLLSSTSLIEFVANGSIDGFTLPDGAPPKAWLLPNHAGTISIWGRQNESISADDTVIVPNGNLLIVTSDDPVATDRSFRLSTTGARGGQRLKVKFNLTASNKCQIDAGATGMRLLGGLVLFDTDNQFTHFTFDDIDSVWEQDQVLAVVS